MQACSLFLHLFNSRQITWLMWRTLSHKMPIFCYYNCPFYFFQKSCTFCLWFNKYRQSYPNTLCLDFSVLPPSGFRGELHYMIRNKQNFLGPPYLLANFYLTKFLENDLSKRLKTGMFLYCKYIILSCHIKDNETLCVMLLETRVINDIYRN